MLQKADRLGTFVLKETTCSMCSTKEFIQSILRGGEVWDQSPGPQELHPVKLQRERVGHQPILVLLLLLLLLQPVPLVRPPRLWAHLRLPILDSLCKKHWVGCQFLLQCTVKVSEVTAMWLLVHPHCSHCGSSTHGIFHRPESWSGVPLPSTLALTFTKPICTGTKGQSPSGQLPASGGEAQTQRKTRQHNKSKTKHCFAIWDTIPGVPEQN